MDGRVSNFDDISILFMKMEIKSGLRLGSKRQQQKFTEPLSSCISYQIPTLLGFNFFMTQHVVVLLIMDMDRSVKFDVYGPKKKYAFGVF